MNWLLATRTRVMLLSLLVLAALDVARSVYARTAYSRPLGLNLTWPPGSDVKAGASPGEKVFAKHCAVCHGPDGKGNGPAAPSMKPRPRDFTAGEYKYKTTAQGSPPTDGDLVAVVKQGLIASGMPYFSDVLSDDEIRDVVRHIKSLGNLGSAPAPVQISPGAAADTASIARGKELYVSKGCAQCHGFDYHGVNKYQDAKGAEVPIRDLTAPWTFRGGADPEQVWLRLTVGMTPGPMPSYEGATTPEERWDLVNFVGSVARIPPWEPGGKLGGPGQDPDPVKRGDYLAHMEMCGLCHTQINHTGIYRDDDAFLAGGMRVGAYPHEMVISRNLTSDAQTGIGGFSAEQIANIMRNGRRPDRTLNPWGMPWFFLHAFTEQDAIAIGSYLKTTAPVSHRVPEPITYGVIETVVAKLTGPLPAALPILLSYADGDFARFGSDSKDDRDLPQRILIDAQYVALLLGAIAFVFAGRRAVKGRAKSRGRRALEAVGILILILAIWVIDGLPTIVPPDQLSKAVLQGVPVPDPKFLAVPEQAALVERGRYLFEVASCAFCHGDDGRGGNKISWKPFGTLWAKNITSDPETGVGTWSDKQIARAIRSGVSRHGGQLHWQGMIWDLLSNMDEEDLRAVIAYLRTLPPVRIKIPSARPPAADDCAIYSFYLRGDMTHPGCR
jgi:mono/diheme cytochrome c family protein